MFDAVTWAAGTAISRIARDVTARSRDSAGYWHDYWTDAACGMDGEGFLNSMCEIMTREARFEAGLGAVPLPCWYDADVISGKRGLDVVDDLVTGTLTRRAGPMILVWPGDVIADLEAIRQRGRDEKSWASGRDEMLRDGALSKCLRVLSVASQPV